MKKALLFIGGTLPGTIIGIPTGFFLFFVRAGADGGCKITKDGKVIWGDPDKREEDDKK